MGRLNDMQETYIYILLGLVGAVFGNFSANWYIVMAYLFGADCLIVHLKRMTILDGRAEGH